MNDAPDFLSLLEQRVTEDTRPMHFQPIAFDFRALAELEVLEGELEEARRAQRVDELNRRNGQPVGDQRMAGIVSPVATLEARQSELVEQVQRSTCLAVFQAPTADEQDKFNAQSKAENWGAPEQARRLIMISFHHWEYRGERLDYMGEAELEKLLPKLSQGELFSISTPLTHTSGGEVLLPKSALAFIKTRQLDGTQRSRSASASPSASGSGGRRQSASRSTRTTTKAS